MTFPPLRGRWPVVALCGALALGLLHPAAADERRPRAGGTAVAPAPLQAPAADATNAMRRPKAGGAVTPRGADDILRAGAAGASPVCGRKYCGAGASSTVADLNPNAPVR